MERTRPPVHWADRKKLEILEQLRRDRTLCAPKPVCATMELDAEDGALLLNISCHGGSPAPCTAHPIPALAVM